MEMEVVVPVAPAVDFNFDSNCSSPYITAPSSPQRFGNFFFSAPTSPTRVSSFLHQLNDLAATTNSSASSSSSVPFHWEQKPGVPKSNTTPQHNNDNNNNNNNNDDDDDDFEFDFSGHLERPSLSADELFDGGKIRPLKLPPRLQSGDGVTSPAATNASSPKSRTKAFSPRHHHKRESFDPFAAAMEETRKREEGPLPAQQQKRGRERALSSPSSFSGRKGSRSLSPLRVSDIVCDSEEKGVPSPTSNNTKTSYASFLSSIPFTKGYRKWRLRDFLLFRSASEGRATDKDPLRKYEVLSKKAAAAEDDVRNSSFRSTESSAGSVSKRRGPVSAHELHYTVNRAASEELKKRTFLPYKRGLLGCLGFNPGGMHEISRGIGSFTRS